jgi:hypothetical protein
MLYRLFLWWCYECQRCWDMNLTSALARVKFGSAVDMSRIRVVFGGPFNESNS